jgi:pSer/pThr/pTyr-binding forkhead associated (FHA) protein
MAYFTIDRQVYTISEVTTIGRRKTSTIALSDMAVSRDHAKITLSGDGQYILSDNGSRNGIFVKSTDNNTPGNGKKVTGPCRLKAGDKVILGSTTLEFHLGRPEVMGTEFPTIRDYLAVLIAA